MAFLVQKVFKKHVFHTKKCHRKAPIVSHAIIMGFLCILFALTKTTVISGLHCLESELGIK